LAFLSLQQKKGGNLTVAARFLRIEPT